MKQIDVTKLVLQGARASEHVRIPGVVAGVSIRGGDGGTVSVDWEHRCIVHRHQAGEDEGGQETLTVVPFENVMYLTCTPPKPELKVASGGKL